MTAFLGVLFRILALQSGPSTIPRSSLLLAIALGVNIVVSMIYIDMLQNLPWAENQSPPPVELTLLVSVAMLLLYAALLQWSGKSSRSTQVLTAMLGVDALLTACAAITLLVLGGTAVVAILFIVVWSIAVRGRIIADGMDWPWMFGCGLELALFFLGSAFIRNAATATVS